jgi:hypothetical protein
MLLRHARPRVKKYYACFENTDWFRTSDVSSLPDEGSNAKIWFGPYSVTGLPDGLLSNQKFQFGRVLLWKIWVYFMTIWSILWPLGICCGNWAYFSLFLTKKNLATSSLGNWISFTSLFKLWPGRLE